MGPGNGRPRPNVSQPSVGVNWESPRRNTATDQPSSRRAAEALLGELWAHQPRGEAGAGQAAW